MRPTPRRSLRALLSAGLLVSGIFAFAPTPAAHYCHGDPTDCGESECYGSEPHDHPCRTLRACTVAPAVCVKVESGTVWSAAAPAISTLP